MKDVYCTGLVNHLVGDRPRVSGLKEVVQGENNFNMTYLALI